MQTSYTRRQVTDMTSQTENPKPEAPTAAPLAPTDLKPMKDAKGGLLPAVQKVREAAGFNGG